MPVEISITSHISNTKNHLYTNRVVADETLRTHFQAISRVGFDSIRYDFSWSEIEPRPGQINFAQLDRYVRARSFMKEAGLKEPTIILGTSIPAWARALYRFDSSGFLDANKRYVQQVHDALANQEGQVERIQVGNEFNTTVDTKFEIRQIPALCEITREVFNSYNPNLQLVGTLLAGNVLGYGEHFGISSDCQKFMRQHQQMLRGNFDAIAVDYYPNLWHLPFREAGFRFQDMPKQLGYLRDVAEELASWGIEYEIGEVGFPTRCPWGDERAQRYNFNIFFRALRQMFIDFSSRSIPLPSRIGIYSAIDEPATTLMGKLLRALLPFPECDFGIYRESGDPKLILTQLPFLMGLLRKLYIVTDFANQYQPS